MDAFGVFSWLIPRQIISDSVLTKTTRVADGVGDISIRTGFFGGDVQVPIQIEKTVIEEGDIITQIYGSTFGGGFGQTVEKVIRTTQEQIAEPSIEKPISIAPALIGGGTVTGTGEADVSGGLPILPIVAVAGIGVLAYFLLKKSPQVKGIKKVKKIFT